MTLKDLLTETIELNASDLHLSAGLPPMARVDGEMVRLNHEIVTAEKAFQLIASVMNRRQIENWKTEQEWDFSFEVPNLSRFRANVFMQSRGPAAAFRVVPSEVKTLDELDAPEVFKNILENHNGLVLVTGPTGSGKSTTLASMINHINQFHSGHIVTIEDPIEFLHKPINCMINQRELGEHTKSFDNALRSALREDPDVILVGEMRDVATIRLALTAAETGHLVFATLHTNSAPKTIDRIVDSFPGSDKDMARTMLAESLRGVICQTLVRGPSGGRVAVHEIMLGTAPIRNLIRENKIAQMMSVMQTGTGQGMQTMAQGAQKLLAAGKIDLETANRLSGKSTRPDL